MLVEELQATSHLCIMILCSKWGALNRGLHAANEIAKDSDKQDFIIFLIFAIIGCAVISLFATLIVKAVFELDKEDSAKAFGIIGGALLIISILGYFIF